jgi:hypothetical protein
LIPYFLSQTIDYLNNLTNNTIKAAAITKKANPAQKGSVTNHQDQVITLHNLRVTNTTPRSPNIPILELEFVEFLDIFYF